MKTTIIGYPRIGKLRELKFAIEKYWKGELTQEALLNKAKELRLEHFTTQKDSGLSILPCNDFSFYDNMLDTTCMLSAIPKRYKDLQLSKLDTYFAMARGYQGKEGDVTAFTMKKWFNTNYHYMVPELDASTKITLDDSTFFDRVKEVSSFIKETNSTCDFKPSVIGPFTFLQLASCKENVCKKDFINDVANCYATLIKKCSDLNISWIQLDEPSLVTTLTQEDIELFKSLYKVIFSQKESYKTKVLLQTYFGDIRDSYKEILSLGFDGIGLDFIEGKQNLSLIQQNPLPKETVLFLGIVNGKNIWKSDYKKSLELIKNVLSIKDRDSNNIVLQTSCSLLHVPYTKTLEEKSLPCNILSRFSFAKEKLNELVELSNLCLQEQKDILQNNSFISNQKDILEAQSQKNLEVQKRLDSLQDEDFIRGGKNALSRQERQNLQRKALDLPLLPTTTIGSFPQTAEVKKNRSLFKKGEITKEQYNAKVFDFIQNCIKEQEELNFDVLVHGEFERNDMVEFFGENLAGFIFTSFAWVQSYGTRCVKPPIIAGDVYRQKPITTEYAKYALSLTKKQVKGMLTGPVTILNWSFPREDIPLSTSCFQIALAIRDEVLDLEKYGVKIIQIDEAALREKLPLRKEDWQAQYLDWAIPAFRLCHSGVKNQTQIHTHMCYSEFEDIISAIDDMDADVITFEASRSKLTILDALKNANFKTEVGPGVYDIHSPRVPSVEEIYNALKKMLEKIPKEKLWVNPDCGLKTRGKEETYKSLQNLILATQKLRKEFI